MSASLNPKTCILQRTSCINLQGLNKCLLSRTFLSGDSSPQHVTRERGRPVGVTGSAVTAALCLARSIGQAPGSEVTVPRTLQDEAQRLGRTARYG